MARLEDHEKALALRKQEMSYSQIKKILKVSKGTLSYWLKNYPLSGQRIGELRDWNEQRIEKCRKTKEKKKVERLNKLYQKQKAIILPLTNRELYLAGLFLYWGEGTKNQSRLSISNTDPSVIKFFITWITRSLKFPKKNLKVQLHLYKDMAIEKEINFWSKTLKIPLPQFIRPYIKKTSSERINHKGSFGHGTCNIRAGNARLSEKILVAMKIISS